VREWKLEIWHWEAILSRPLQLAAVLGSALLILVTLTGCSSNSLLASASFQPATITPDGDGQNDATQINYTLNRNARISIYLQDASSQRFYFRRDQARSAGPYSVLFGGVIDNRMLPNGTYTWVVSAGDGGQTQERAGTLTISGADTTPLEIAGLTASPPVFTPNRDGISDRATINVSINKDASLQVYLRGADNVQYPVTEKPGLRPPGEKGLHTFDYDAGVDNGAEPPPDGAYTVYAEATDQVGQHALATTTLTIQDGGVPRAEIVDGQVDSSVCPTPNAQCPVRLGDTIYFTFTVENYGTVPIRTSGPQPGACYDLDQNFNAPQPNRPQGYAEESGVFRAAIGFDTQLMNYPFRWAIGEPGDLEKRTIDGQDYYYLPAGKRAVITGCIRVTSVPPRNPLYFWAGLIHEDVEISQLNDRVDPHYVYIGAP
jgi:hypothetical protein